MNHRASKRIPSTARIVLAGMLAGVWSSAPAALSVPNIPIFLANDVQANIFFALDDSGSMDWEVLVPEPAVTAHTKLWSQFGIPGPGPQTPLTDVTGLIDRTSAVESCVPGTISRVRIRNRDVFVQDCTDVRVTPAEDGNLRPPATFDDYSPDDIFEDLELCPGFNVLAYDPNVRYTPWIGVDVNGTPYANQTLASARVNPYDPAAGTVDLRTAAPGKPRIYGRWTDDGDGVYEVGECPIGDNGAGAPATEVSPQVDYGLRRHSDARWVDVATLSAEDQTNYANWWSYYRKREHILKRAVSALINASQQRMGLATLHNNNSVGTAVRDMRVQGSKNNLMRSLFRIDSSGATPLRRLLDNTGRYFDDTDAGDGLHSALGIAEGTPMLPATEGGSCQQNFTVLFSDGFWNGPDPSVGNTDGDGNSAYDGGPHADEFSNTLADVAMKYYETDLSNTLDNTVPTVENEDENPAQHMVTYTVSFGLDGTLTNADTPRDRNPATPPPPWPRPVANAVTTADDMRHAAFNARGLFLAGQNAQGLIDTLNAALSSIATRIGAASAVAATSTQIQTDTLIFQGKFDTDNWNGELNAFELRPGGEISRDPVWNAADVIPAAASRNIFTYIDNATGGAEFRWANLKPAQQALIGSEAVLNYVRGDRSREINNGGLLRDRRDPAGAPAGTGTPFGDIIHSSPVAVTSAITPPPYQQLPGAEGASFLQFVRDTLDRLDMVYVGANDGALHGFRTDTGEEVLAYVPRALFGKLPALSRPGYPHEFYVDGQLQVAPAYIDGAWHTLLVGALGRGGAAIFGLDVTDPATFNAGDVLWEFTDAELGLVLGEVQIVRLNNGRWAGITGNGYNSASERASLFIIDLADGSVIRRLDTNVGGPLAPNGLGEVLVVDLNEDLRADVAYGGDLRGNVWKFDLTDPSAANWTVALSGSPLYTARDASGAPQPITTRPAAIPHPDGGFVVLFGTGRYFVQGDDATGVNPQVQTFYGVRDQGSPVASVTVRNDAILQSQHIILEDEIDFDGVTVPVRALSANSVDWVTQHGWYLDLVSPVNGAESERVIADPQVRFDRIIFNTFVPSESCQLGGGRSWLMEFDALTGARLEFTVFDLNRDDRFDALEYVTLDDGTQVPVSGRSLPLTLAPPAVVAEEEGTTEYKITSGLTGEIDATAELGAGTSLGRQSWRQIR